MLALRQRGQAHLFRLARRLVLRVRAAVLDHAPRVEVQDAGDGLVEKDQVVADHDHRPPTRAQEVHQPRLGVAVEVVGRLVEQQQVGVGEEGARELEPPALSAGQNTQRQVDAAFLKPQARSDPAGIRLARVAAVQPVALLSVGEPLDVGE